MKTTFAIAFCLFSGSVIAAEQQKELFETDAVYTISTTVGGKEYALTYVLPEGFPKGALVGNLVTSGPTIPLVRLMPLSKGDATQVWKPTLAQASRGTYYLYARISEFDTSLTRVMEVADTNSKFSDPNNDTYHDKYNRVTMGLSSGEGKEHWHIKKLDNGMFSIMSYYGNSPGEWGESRSLEAFKGTDGKIRLRHGKTSDAANQQWKFTNVGFYTSK